MATKRKPKRARDSEPKKRKRKSVQGKVKTKPKRDSKSQAKRSATKPEIAKRKQATKPKLRKARVLSKTADAVRARERRKAAKPKPRKRAAKKATARERRAIAEAELAERLGLTGPARIASSKRKRGVEVDIEAERELAIGWLEALRDLASTVTPTSLEITDPHGKSMIAPERATVGGNAPWGRGRERVRGGGTPRRPWLVVGRFDFLQGASYEMIGEILQAWRSDYALEVAINPDRLSQIRVIYVDPKERRGEGDDFISQIGAWAFIVDELYHEIVGTGVSGDVDQDALVARYAESIVPRLYVYFSPDMMGGVTIDIGKEVVKRFKL